MRRMASVIILLWVMAAVRVSGQVGDSQAAFSNRWGEAASGTLDEKGNGGLQFASGDMIVEAEFVDGVAQRVIYRSPTLNQQGFQDLLAANSGGSSWQRFRRPGRGEPERRSKRSWMRADERGMAEAGDGVLTIVGSGWYRHVAEASSPGPQGGQAAGPSPAAATNMAAADSKHRDEFVGLWRCRASGQPMVVLRVRAEGVLSWVVFGAAEQRSVELRWGCETTGARVAFTIARDERVVGRLDMVSTNTLRWRPETEVVEEDGDGDPEHLKAGALFEWTPEMPLWKPSAPATLPAKGDSRETVIRILGRPAGTMSVSGREVLVYPWGNIWIANGVVSAID